VCEETRFGVAQRFQRCVQWLVFSRGLSRAVTATKIETAFEAAGFLEDSPDNFSTAFHSKIL